MFRLIILPVIFVLAATAPAIWKDIHGQLKADAIYQKSFVAQFDLDELNRLSKNQKARLIQLQELQIDLCASSDLGIEDTAKAIQSGMFQYIAMPAENLLGLTNERGSKWLNCSLRWHQRIKQSLWQLALKRIARLSASWTILFIWLKVT